MIWQTNENQRRMTNLDLTGMSVPGHFWVVLASALDVRYAEVFEDLLDGLPRASGGWKRKKSKQGQERHMFEGGKKCINSSRTEGSLSYENLGAEGIHPVSIRTSVEHEHTDDQSALRGRNVTKDIWP